MQDRSTLVGELEPDGEEEEEVAEEGDEAEEREQQPVEEHVHRRGPRGPTRQEGRREGPEWGGEDVQAPARVEQVAVGDGGIGFVVGRGGGM